MKCTNEQNRKQKQWLDIIERRLGYAWMLNTCHSKLIIEREKYGWIGKKEK